MRTVRWACADAEVRRWWGGRYLVLTLVSALGWPSGFAQERLGFLCCGHAPRRCVHLLKLTQELHFLWQVCVLRASQQNVTWSLITALSCFPVYFMAKQVVLPLRQDSMKNLSKRVPCTGMETGFSWVLFFWGPTCRLCLPLSTLSSVCSWSLQPEAGCFRYLQQSMKSRSWPVLVLAGGEICFPLHPLIAGGCETVIWPGKQTPLEL